MRMTLMALVMVMISSPSYTRVKENLKESALSPVVSEVKKGQKKKSQEFKKVRVRSQKTDQ